MEVRPAAPADVPAVVPMVAKICAFHEAWDPAKYSFLPGTPERYRHWLTTRAGDERSVFLVADANPKLVGFLIGTVENEIPIYRLKQYGFIHDLWVDEDYRHEGVGRQLVMMAVERFKAMGMEQVRLDTAFPNDVARKLFASCGFRPSTTEMLLQLTV
jgi:ribosomal protein S18 acetylase RimI-like enzyme